MNLEITLASWTSWISFIRTRIQTFSLIEKVVWITTEAFCVITRFAVGWTIYKQVKERERDHRNPHLYRSNLYNIFSQSKNRDRPLGIKYSWYHKLSTVCYRILRSELNKRLFRIKQIIKELITTQRGIFSWRRASPIWTWCIAFTISRTEPVASRASQSKICCSKFNAAESGAKISLSIWDKSSRYYLLVDLVTPPSRRHHSHDWNIATKWVCFTTDSQDG